MANLLDSRKLAQKTNNKMRNKNNYKEAGRGIGEENGGEYDPKERDA